MATKWELRGQQLVEALRGVTTANQIKELAEPVVAEIIAAYPDTPNSRRVPLTTIRKEVLYAFPDTDSFEHSLQEFTDSGKGNIRRYQHLALKFLSFPKADWDALGDNARKEYLAEQAQTQAHTTIMIDTQDLDPETLSLIEMAAQQLGMSAKDFFIKAARDAAKAINNKRKRYDGTDLASVPTLDLLENTSDEYKTHPGRIEELTRRAVRAIQIHNDDCTEQSQKWFISATAINALTGSRTSAISKVLNSLHGVVADHNAKHGLTSITNRGSRRDIQDEIDLVALVPDGLDL